MTSPRIQLLVFDGCPLADAARRALDEAVAALDLGPYETVDILDPDVPDDVKNWGSPTILIDGRDVAGGNRGDSVGCRVYTGHSGVPDASEIVQFVRDRGVRSSDSAYD